CVSSCTLAHVFFNAPATPDIYTLSLHDALPICACCRVRGAAAAGPLAAGCGCTATGDDRELRELVDHVDRRAELDGPGPSALGDLARRDDDAVVLQHRGQVLWAEARRREPVRVGPDPHLVLLLTGDGDRPDTLHVLEGRYDDVLHGVGEGAGALVPRHGQLHDGHVVHRPCRDLRADVLREPGLRAGDGGLQTLGRRL